MPKAFCIKTPAAVALAVSVESKRTVKINTNEFRNCRSRGWKGLDGSMELLFKDQAGVTILVFVDVISWFQSFPFGYPRHEVTTK
jgi:hypothetical protein